MNKPKGETKKKKEEKEKPEEKEPEKEEPKKQKKGIEKLDKEDEKESSVGSYLKELGEEVKSLNFPAISKRLGPGRIGCGTKKA